MAMWPRQITVALWSAWLTLGSALATAAEPSEPQRDLEAVRERIQAIQESLQQARGKRDAVVGRLREMDKAIGRASRALAEIKSQLAASQTALTELEDRRDKVRAALADQRERLARQLRAAYVIGRQERVKLLLNQEDPATVGRVLTYYQYLARARTRRIETVREQLAELRRLETAIDDKRQRLGRLRDERAAKLERLEATRGERERLLDELEQRIQSQGARLSELKEDEQRLEELVERLGEVFGQLPEQGQTRFSALKGRLPWPAPGRLEARFGDKRSGGNLRWRGVLIDAPPGRTVRAVSHGRVAYADWLRGFGLLMIIDHGNGYMSLYGHNQSLFKETGEWIQPGEAVATVGSSGGSGEPALYFELRHDGQPVDPLSWCQPVQGGRIVQAITH